jgi:threonine aldolase
MKMIDLRSDTVTRPTAEMRKAMFEAEVGDDVIGDDETTKEFEAKAAELLGKEAALFVPSGTFGNQLALFTHCSRGDEVILSDTSHIVQHEVAAASMIAGVQLRTIAPRRSYVTWSEIDLRLRKEEDIHCPPTGLIALENALSNGDVMPLEEMSKIHTEARRFGVPIHLDGARIFNAASYLEIEASEIARYADSVMFCISKGLCAPIGSLLVGEAGFIVKARKKRKIMGGGMRQTGILAAAGLLALEKMTRRLHEDHLKMEKLAQIIGSCGVFEVEPKEPKINMIFVRFRDERLRNREGVFVENLGKNGIVTYPPMDGWVRFVTHHDVSSEDIELFGSQIDSVLESCLDQAHNTE